MKRRCTMQSVISGFMASLILGNLAYGEEIKTELEEIVVSATKTERKLKEVSTNITVLTEEDLKKYDARDVSELLRQIPGFNISAFGGVHADVYVSSRGNVPLTRGAQILVNGIEYNNPSGYFNVLAIPIGDIERIEVIKSPVTALYGNLATGGIVNIVTKRPTKPIEARIHLSYGSWDTQRYSTVIKGIVNRLEYYVEGRFYKTQGWQDNSWEENKLLNTILRYGLSDTANIGLHFNYAPIKNGYPGPLTKKQFKEDPKRTNQPWGDADSYTLILAPYFEKNFKSSKVVFKLKYGFQDGWCIDPDYFEFRNYNILPEINYSISHSIRGVPGVLLIGAEYRHLNNEKIKAYTVKDGKKNQLYQDREWKDYTIGLFIQEELKVSKKLTFNIGLRYDWVKTDFQDKIRPDLNFEKKHSALSPKAGLTYSINDNINLFINYSRGFRNPTTAITAFMRNPNLKPEKINSYEIGLRWAPTSWFYLNSALFLIDTHDKIVRVGGPRIAENAGKTRSKGIEFELNIVLPKGFYSSLNYTYQESLFKKYKTLGGVSYKNKAIPLVPNHLLGIGLGYRSDWLGDLVVVANYSGKRYTDPANTGVLSDYLVIDAKYTKRLGKNIELFVSGKNLTDRRYAEVGFGSGDNVELYPMPGVSVLGGINIYF